MSLSSPAVFFCLFCPLSHSFLLLGQWWYVCQLPPVLECLSSTSPPSIYLDAIYTLPRSLCSLSSGCVYTDGPNQLSPLFSTTALFFPSLRLLLTSGCTAGKLCYSYHFLFLPLTVISLSCLHGWIDTIHSAVTAWTPPLRLTSFVLRRSSFFITRSNWQHARFMIPALLFFPSYC